MTTIDIIWFQFVGTILIKVWFLFNTVPPFRWEVVRFLSLPFYYFISSCSVHLLIYQVVSVRR